MNEIDKVLMEVNNIKKDMETALRHDKKFNDSIDNLELIVADLRLTLSLFKEQNKTIPERVRALEDKSIVTEFIKVGGWFILGALIYAFVNQQFVATREREYYINEKSK